MSEGLPLYRGLLALFLCGCAVFPVPTRPDATAITGTRAPIHTPSPAPTVTPAASPTPAIEPDLEAIARDYPRVDGSTSTHPLQMTIACQIYGVPCRWSSPDEDEALLLFTTERRIVPDLPELASLDPANDVFLLFHTGTHQSYVNLIEGGTDFILVARPPSDDERRAANGAGVTLDVRAVALDAFVFLVHDSNLVTDLDLKSLRAIYSGEVTHWSEVGGAEEEIHPYTRDLNSGSQELMVKLVMRGAPTLDAPDMMLETMMGPINQIEEDALGIGYSVFFYATFMYPHEHVRLIAVEGVAPTSENIASGDYPLATEVYAVVLADQPAGSPARMLRDWLLTDAGQAAVAESGYVPLR